MWYILPLICFITVTDQIHASDEENLEGVVDAKQFYDLDKVKDLFNEFIVTYQKEYNDEDYAKKLEVFKKNLEKINELNKNSTTVAYGITRFADLTSEEIQNYTGVTKPSLRYNSFCPYIIYQPKGPIPPQLDYRKLGYVTPVRDQLSCGSCYAHSTVGNLEGQYFKKYGRLLAFSEQQIVDCSAMTNGCNGGYEDMVMTYLHEVGGIQSYIDYPYKGLQGYCRFKQHKTIAKVSGCLKLAFAHEEHLAHALYEYGPLSITISSAEDITAYRHGVMPADYVQKENSRGLTHAVLLVGYGTEKGVPFWIIKNSWSTTWGEKGFARIIRGKKLLSISAAAVTAFIE